MTGAALHARHATVVAAAGESGGIDALMPFVAYLLPLWLVVAVTLLAGSVVFALAVARGETGYRPAMALANPAVLVLVIAAGASFSTWSRALIVPASPNLAHVVFFALASSRGARAHAAVSQPPRLRRQNPQ